MKLEGNHHDSKQGFSGMDSFYEDLKQRFLHTGEIGRQALTIFGSLFAKEILDESILQKMATHIEQDIRHGDIDNAEHLAEALDVLVKKSDPTKSAEVRSEVRNITGIYFEDKMEEKS